MKKITFLLTTFLISIVLATAQEKALVNTSKSKYAKLRGVNIKDVAYTNGFWAERFDICKNTMMPFLWQILNDAKVSHSYRNFEIAAGLEHGEHEGPPFHDGDFYKWFESLVSVYSQTKDKELEKLMNEIIAVFAKVQREDGYIHTPVIIEQLKHPEKKAEFRERLDFETYNLGHLMTAACLHYRATAQKSLLEIAKKSADFMYNFYKRSPEELAKNAICPSHYMGVTEMYRTTGDAKYLELATKLVEIRSLVNDGTDHNQDRIPFKKQTKAIGHAVRANYLYAGVTDVYLETGDDSLFHALDLIWNDLITRKLYITGACGALYDGVSPNGTSYTPSYIQQVHQSYGRDYQLPNITAHNESCANIGLMLWNWRMLQATAQAKYADMLELTMYNSLLSAVSLDGKRHFYTNPLCVTADLPYTLRWSKEREEYISLCNCCPPNTVRTVSEIQDYIYSLSDDGLYINLYTGSTLSTKLLNGHEIKLEQETNYPWNGKINITFKETPKKKFSVFLRVPGWCSNATLSVNGKPAGIILTPGTYAEIKRKWSKSDQIELNLTMPVQLIEANPLVEETRNHVAVKRGPVVYCIESIDIPDGNKLFDVSVPADIQFNTIQITIDNANMTALQGKYNIVNNKSWDNQLYREISKDSHNTASIKLIPYYAWGNRGKTDMTVWIPLDR